jgi:hypothetical protein
MDTEEPENKNSKNDKNESAINGRPAIPDTEILATGDQR